MHFSRLHAITKQVFINPELLAKASDHVTLHIMMQSHLDVSSTAFIHRTLEMFCTSSVQVVPSTGSNQLLPLPPVWQDMTLDMLLEFVRAVMTGTHLAGGA